MPDHLINNPAPSPLANPKVVGPSEPNLGDPRVAKMKVCNCQIRLSPGHTVPGSDVTPAEALLLTSIHKQNAGGVVITDIADEREVSRSVQQELARLRNKFHADKIKACFPGNLPTFPSSFSEAEQAGLGVESPEVQLVPPTKVNA